MTSEIQEKAKHLLARALAAEEAKGFAGRFGEEQAHIPKCIALDAIAAAVADAEVARVEVARWQALCEAYQLLARTAEGRASRTQRLHKEEVAGLNQVLTEALEDLEGADATIATVRARVADLAAWLKSGNDVPSDLPFVFRERWQKIAADIRALEAAVGAAQ